MSRVPLLLSWSSGKDSAWSLGVLRADPAVEVVGLLTTFDASRDRAAMHSVRRELVEAQARAAGLPLWSVELPWPCPNEEYERRMGALCERARADGVRAVAFGDLFLEDVRAYREEKLRGSGLEPRFPLWGRDTRELAREMQAGGLRAVVTCVDEAQVPAELVGRAWDAELLAALPPDADPCGENGEFHTFVHAAPAFDEPLAIEVGDVVESAGLRFADVRLAP